MAIIETLYACHSSGSSSRNLRSKVSGVWGDAFSFPINYSPRALSVAPDGTIWLAAQYLFGSLHRLWRKLPAGGWVDVAAIPTSPDSLSAVDQDEVWLSNGHIAVYRYTTGAGWVGWNLEATITSGVEFRQSLIHAYGSNEVVVVGKDGALKIWITRWTGSSWSDPEDGFSTNGGFIHSIFADGDNLYFGMGDAFNGSYTKLWKHSNRGIGSGWTEIGLSGTGWPTNLHVPNGIWVNPNDPNDIWVCFGMPSATGADVARTTNGGASWTTYTVGNPTYGCCSITGDSNGKVYIGHNQDDLVAVWNGASFDPDESSGLGNFVGYAWGPNSDQAFQRLVLARISIDLEGPELVPIEPAAGATGVEKDAAVTFKLIDETGTILADTAVYVRGELVFDGELFTDGWQDSEYAANDSNGYTFVIRPDRSNYWRNGEAVRIRATSKDTLDVTSDSSYIFTAVNRVLRVSTYEMITRSIRKKDEES